jgi:hypothetical protein
MTLCGASGGVPHIADHDDQMQYDQLLLEDAAIQNRVPKT